MMRNGILAIAICFAGLAGPALADDEAAPVCENRGTNGMVSMLLCPEGLNAEDYAREGRAICEDRKPCGAWIWTDAAAIPEETPASHDEIPQASVQSAMAIWVNEADKLISLEKQARE